MNLDPAAPDFFDYTTAEWFTTRSARWTGTSPAPTSTTPARTSTRSPPRPRSPGRRLIGLAAADVPVARLERQVLPALLALPRPMALVNDAGRVVAAASPTLSPGLLLAPGTGGVRLDDGPEGRSPATWRLEPTP